MKIVTKLFLPVTTAVMVAGCASSGVKNTSGAPTTQMNTDEQGFVAGTGIESQDLVAATGKMAESILGIPKIASAPVPPVIVLDSVDNRTRFPINKDTFLTDIGSELNSKTHGKILFLTRDRMAALENERNLKPEGATTTNNGPGAREFKDADYFLTGTLQDMSTRTKSGTSDYILYAFQLIDMRTGAIVWGDNAELKRQGMEGAVYR